MIEYPKQAEGIEVNAVADGYIVYQSVENRVHYLNHTGALVLELCNGTVKASEMPELLKGAFELNEAPIEEVDNCLEMLIAEGIVQ